MSERVSEQSSSSVSLFGRFFCVRQTKPPLIRLIVRKPSAAGSNLISLVQHGLARNTGPVYTSDVFTVRTRKSG